MADSGPNKLLAEQQHQEQSTLAWLYDTAVSFLPSWPSTPDQSVVAQQQPTSESCQETGQKVCHCNKNKNKF